MDLDTFEQIPCRRRLGDALKYLKEQETIDL